MFLYHTVLYIMSKNRVNFNNLFILDGQKHAFMKKRCLFKHFNYEHSLNNILLYPLYDCIVCKFAKIFYKSILCKVKMALP